VDDFWIMDTSSIIEIRRRIPNSVRSRVFSGLDSLVDKGFLIYPSEVVVELERYVDPKDPDTQFQWAKRNQQKACRHGPQLELVRKVLAHPQVRRVLDPDKVSTEEADPYVLALALHIKQDSTAIVITEEVRDTPTKMSLTTACGLLKLYRLSLEAFLVEQGIYEPFSQ
jgi:hypothetical protein